MSGAKNSSRVALTLSRFGVYSHPHWEVSMKIPAKATRTRHPATAKTSAPNGGEPIVHLNPAPTQPSTPKNATLRTAALKTTGGQPVVYMGLPPTPQSSTPTDTILRTVDLKATGGQPVVHIGPPPTQSSTTESAALEATGGQPVVHIGPPPTQSSTLQARHLGR